MSKRLEEFKPAASARTHLLLAALMWTVVGALLALFGARWALAADFPYAVVVLVIAAAIGVLKAEFVLVRAARRAIDRIRTRGDGRCIGGFLSIRTWLLVILMMAIGYGLRHGLAPRGIVGVIYVAIGTALLTAARRFWWAWYQYATET